MKSSYTPSMLPVRVNKIPDMMYCRQLDKTEREDASVHLYNSEEHGELLVKITPKALLNHEIAIARVINQHSLPEVCEAIGVMKTEELGIRSRQEYCAVMSYISNADPLSVVLRQQTVSDDEIVGVLCHTLAVLQYLYDRHEFTHYDLHTSNVMVQLSVTYDESREPWRVPRQFNTLKYSYAFDTHYIPVLIDFEFSHVKHPSGETIGINGVEPTGIKCCPNPSFDIHSLLTDAINHRPSLTKYLRPALDLILKVDKTVKDEEYEKLVCRNVAGVPQILYWPYNVRVTYEDAITAILKSNELSSVFRNDIRWKSVIRRNNG